jgi:glycosyltransferase involved in cell wall biosynthesis
VIEAMAAGLPVVMTRSTDTSLLVEEGANGYTAGASADELARHIEALLDDEERRLRFSEHSRELARRNFDAPDSAWLLARVYLEEWERAQ